MEPLVTAVITTYRRDKAVLTRAINSVLNQTYTNIELIIVDDNGVDSDYHKMVLELVNSYPLNSISLISNLKNLGAQVSRNKGIEFANGEYLALLDDDDEWLPSKIEDQINVFTDSHKNLGLVYSWYIRVDVGKNDIEKYSTIESPSYESSVIVKQLLRKNFIPTNSIPLLRLSKVREIGGYDENLPSSQDLDLWIRLAAVSDFFCINKPLTKYYQHYGERISNNPQKKIEGVSKFYNKYKKLIDEDEKASVHIFSLIASFMIKGGQFSEARTVLKGLYKTYKLRDLSFRSIGLYLKSYLVQWGIMGI